MNRTGSVSVALSSLRPSSAVPAIRPILAKPRSPPGRVRLAPPVRAIRLESSATSTISQQRRRLATMAESAVASTSTLPPDLSAYLKPPASLSAAAPSPSFYKRPLPESCIAFDSAEGKRMFKTALNDGYMEKYFILAQSFLTQNEVGSRLPFIPT